jgi:hypothetical protein
LFPILNDINFTAPTVNDLCDNDPPSYVCGAATPRCILYAPRSSRHYSQHIDLKRDFLFIDEKRRILTASFLCRIQEKKHGKAGKGGLEEETVVIIFDRVGFFEYALHDDQKSLGANF